MRPAEIPIAEAMRRFCVTARIRRPKGVARRTSCSAMKTMTVNKMIHMRPAVISRPPSAKDPDMKGGAATGRLSAPNTVRTSCWSTSETPQVASSVSSGRP